MVLLSLAAMVLQLAEAPKAFELIEEGLPKGDVYVSCVSRSGLTAVVNNGREIAILQGSTVTPVRGLTMSMARPIAIRDDGLIVLEKVGALFLHKNGSTRSFPGMQCVVVQGTPASFGDDGLYYATVMSPNPSAPLYRNLRVGDAELEEIHHGGNTPSDSAFRVFDDTSRGFLCEFFFKDPPHSGGETWRYFASFLQGNSVARFEIPAAASISSITTWSDDATTVAGHYVLRAKPVPVIWRDGRILDVLYVGANLPASADLTGMTKDGDMAVGCRPGRRPEMALIWQEGKGLRTLAAFATELKIEIPAGWTLIDAVGITKNGATITGTAKNEKDKRVRPFRLTLTTTKATAWEGSK